MGREDHRRPRWREWWVALVARLRTTFDSDPESDVHDSPHRRTSAERARFWTEFRDGQREANLRALEDRKGLVPCREDGASK